MTQLHDSHILVVGATGGLGSAIARRLAEEGAQLTLSGRNQDKLDKLAAELGDAVTTTVTSDLSLPDGPSKIVEAASADDRRLDGVVYAVGVVAFGPITSADDDVIDEIMLLNLIAPMRLMRSLPPVLNAGAVVVHLSAIVAEKPMKNMAVYSASKAALTAFSTALSAELRRYKIRVLDVRPPHTETGLVTRAISGEAPTLAEGKSPDDVAARIVQAMASDESELPSSAFEMDK
ncbi:SDR family NAD(P)-dependent oxidoreductase [Arthrobacter roseus]|uniref:SDR family NAD(P)-dependent oxidoreductase n=1 Tax=Arthrobacter roseus TaxID=136274 RepID=UPI001963DCB2|nr:SDR family NAD(P)-dependent oxidoreductase [Arthrobacter roseus]MBM7849606.1 short-subunit dehydrogenase [Arthrobacter roseus]